MNGPRAEIVAKPALVAVDTATAPVDTEADFEDEAVHAAKLTLDANERKMTTPAVIDIRVERFMPRCSPGTARSARRFTVAPLRSLR